MIEKGIKNRCIKQSITPTRLMYYFAHIYIYIYILLLVNLQIIWFIEK